MNSEHKKKETKEVSQEVFQRLSQGILAGMTTVAAGGDEITAAIATIVGGFANLRGKLKANRVNSFVIELMKYTDSFRDQFNLEYIDSDEFGDIFEEIVLNVSKTNSKRKLEFFRNIVASQAIEPKETDVSLRFIRLVKELEEIQIQLLVHWKENESKYRAVAVGPRKSTLRMQEFSKNSKSTKYSHYYSKPDPSLIDKEPENEEEAEAIEIMKLKIEEEKKVFETMKPREIFWQICDESELHYLINDLISKGFLRSTEINSKGDSLFSRNELTKFGEDFLEYLRI